MSATVDELIATLQALPAEHRALPVVLEGCDCIQTASGKVIVQPAKTRDCDPYVLLENEQ